MYDVNLTTIQSWDYADWNSTKNNEKRTVLGKYWLNFLKEIDDDDINTSIFIG